MVVITPPTKPLVVIVAGPNGGGKSTVASHLLRDTLEVREFVNADAIAAGLSPFRADTVAVEAGRIMLQRMRALAAAGENFAFETTLASRSLVPWLRRLQNTGYHVHLLFLGLRTPELAVTRVAERVRLGGHEVPAGVVRQRFRTGLLNFFQLYLPVVDSWDLFDNSGAGRPRPIAAGAGPTARVISDPESWNRLKGTFDA